MTTGSGKFPKIKMQPLPNDSNANKNGDGNRLESKLSSLNGMAESSIAGNSSLGKARFLSNRSVTPN